MSDRNIHPHIPSSVPSDEGSLGAAEGPSCAYRITVKGALDEGWSSWFDGLRIVRDANGDTALVGEVRDQAALHGLLAKIRDLGLTLTAVEPMAEGPVR